MRYKPTRRTLLATLVAAPPVILLSGKSGTPLSALPLPATPACGGSTVEQTAGPYYLPNAPLKQDLAADVRGGEPFILTGFIFDRRCSPMAGVLVEVWHANQQGHYDNAGFVLRGHQYSDEHGRWRFNTIMTQHYAFRTAHYHFRVRRPDGSVLTTQLYLPGHPRNASDPLFDTRLLLDLRSDGTQRLGRFDFVI